MRERKTKKKEKEETFGGIAIVVTVMVCLITGIFIGILIASIT